MQWAYLQQEKIHTMTCIVEMPYQWVRKRTFIAIVNKIFDYLENSTYAISLKIVTDSLIVII
jgi:hypothetical protein